MRATPAITAVALSLIACAVSSCSSDSGGKPAPASLGPSVSAPATPSGPVITDSAALQRALLGADDMPPGFAAIGDAAPPLEQAGATPTPAPDKSHTEPAECSGVLALLSDQQKGSAAHAVVRYGGASFSSIDIDAASYADKGAATAFAGVQSLFARCGHYSGTDADGIKVDYRIERLDQPKAGDASASVRLLTTSDGFTLTSDVVVAVVGSTVVQISATGEDPVDPKVLADLTSKQADRLRGADGA